jgi:hypothetical protein
VLIGNDQDNLYSVCLALLCNAVSFTGVIDVPKDIAVATGVDYMFSVIDEVIRHRVFFWTLVLEKVLSRIVQVIGHDVTCIVAEDRTFG